MAVLNYSKKCECCGGNRWQYKKETKVWVCMYCGGQVERKEQYDGLYTIKNVVRQVILDAAYRRIDAGNRNLSECMKIDAQYPGTLIASICIRMIAAISGAYSRQEIQSALSQVKRDYQALNADDDVLGDDETAVYEFLDSSDAWALLAVVFDTLNDTARSEYLLTLVDFSQVFSKETNKSLIRYAMKKKDLELAGKILAVHENIDLKDSLQVSLQQCPDGEEKGILASKLIAAGAMKAGDEEILDDYLEGQDCAQTKMRIAVEACRKNMKPQVPIILRTICAAVDNEALAEMLQAMFTRRLFDNELEAIMSFAASRGSYDSCMTVLETMVNSEQFIALNVRQAQTFLTNTNFTADERCGLIPVLGKMHCSERLWESVLGACLNSGKEKGEDHQKILRALCGVSKSVPAKDFEAYVLRHTGDELKKPEIIQMMFDLPEMNAGFFRNLAGNYLLSGQDLPQVRGEVLHQLMECHLTIDSSLLIQYVCSDADSADNVVNLVQSAVRSGTVLRADALSTYLEKCTTFSPQIFALLYKDASSVSRKAIENYVLHCSDSPAVKANNAKTLAARMGVPLGSTECTFSFAGSSIRGQLGHCYILTTGDPINLMDAMVSAMLQSGMQLNTTIRVDGKDKKFGKYVTEVRGRLSEGAEKICQENRLFSRLFGF